MAWLRERHQKSLLGQLLVKKKLITEEQLARAIEHQRRTGQRLGEIFAEWNLLSEHHLHEVLRTQRNLRLAAMLTTALLAPLETYAVAPATVPQTVARAADDEKQSLRSLSEEELERISGQGWVDTTQRYLQSLRSSSKDDGVHVLGNIARLVNPLLGFLDADVTTKNVVYDAANATSVVNPDGSITLRMPSSIGEIDFDNIRVKGTSGPSFGSIAIRSIDFTGTTVTVAPLKR